MKPSEQPPPCLRNHLTGPAGAPYPGVRELRRSDGSTVYKAQHVHRRPGNKFVCKVLGIYENPLRAYYEIINSRANAAEARAKILRAEADQVLSDLVTKRGPR
jgi:hypothetical protein